jgi:hypothetical protein
MDNAVFLDVTRRDSRKNRRFGGTYRSIIRVTRIGELGTMVAVTGSPILVTLMMEGIRSSVTSLLIKTTRRYIPEDRILHVHTSFDGTVNLYYN